MVTFGLRFKQLILLLGDAVLFEAALAATLFLRYGELTDAMWQLHATPFGIITVLWIAGFYVAGLYDLDLERSGVKYFRMYLEAMFANLAVAFAFFYLISTFGIEPRTNLFLYFAISLLLAYSWRIFYNRFVSNAFFRSRLLYVGSGSEALKLRHLIEQPAYGFDLVAVMETEEGERFEDTKIAWHRAVDQLPEIVKRDRIDTILLGRPLHEIPRLRDALYKTLFTTAAIVDRSALDEALTGRVPLEYVSQTWFLEHLREREKTWYEGMKRLSDIVISIPVLLLTLIISPIVALAIKLSSKGPLFVTQTRIGKMGMPFTIWKFRTMVEDAEEEGKPQYASKDDPRITRVGKLLRATRIDELPQIWNVLRGDMSLIGPRPERGEFVEELVEEMPYYALRHLIRPGLSGWAQVKFPYAGTFEENLKKLQYDLFYIKNRSLLLDAAILLKTIGIVLRRQGT